MQVVACLALVLGLWTLSTRYEQRRGPSERCLLILGRVLIAAAVFLALTATLPAAPTHPSSKCVRSHTCRVADSTDFAPRAPLAHTY
jgi:hypothetical protein